MCVCVGTCGETCTCMLLEAYIRLCIRTIAIAVERSARATRERVLIVEVCYIYVCGFGATHTRCRCTRFGILFMASFLLLALVYQSHVSLPPRVNREEYCA